MNLFLYSLLLYLALPFVPLRLLWRGIKQPAYRQHWGERFGFYPASTTKPIIWLHCVSVGETRAAEPLVKALQTNYPQYQILITNTTPTGREASVALFGDSIKRVYLPYDVPFAVNNFLKHFKPKIGLIMETELWFNLIAACKQREIPLLLLNARLSEKSASGYAKISKLASAGLQNLSAIAAQTEEDAARLRALGAQNLSVAGNLKFDVKPPADSVDKGLQLRKQLGNKPIFLAASTRDGEEELILDAVRDLDLLTIIVPRHPQRFEAVAAILEKRNIAFQRKSLLKNDALQPNIHAASGVVILGDTMGEMPIYYAACDFAFIGGSLLNHGGQNLIEAAAMGKPILIGEHTFNFAKATENAVEAGAAIRVKDTAELRDNIQYLLENATRRLKMSQAALRFNEVSAGATARLMKLIAQYLH
ncbi:MAG: lipid IV(A) 3-deoxy-D-manno-octulosonic acid transferase [Methylotenera sp.]